MVDTLSVVNATMDGGARRLQHRAALSGCLRGQVVELGLWLGLGNDTQCLVKSLAGTGEGAPDIKGQARLKAIGGALGSTQLGQGFSDAKCDEFHRGQVGGRLGV